ncbi:hypothetical protein A2765_05265 [Candidatus Kaiserbacteria bacterium RIFCSPHIGHO2_01_FULL_56_24]|uniref:Uncharacterized protein n=1 Tax=Candidatus Kaiserbacteria bacterium RIFCSPHIGHO2_01_FULL_56_24 TaxID=1798487 RepID=A0A1F6DBK3_9BACT|nr:MAG: hypothetical protein A2765_05265 [Candidatus Kaiserbacteria bacterium RIFCSPHIGHO2_01_FULL_56_24]
MWTLKSGERVVDRHNSHLHGDVAALLPAALAEIESGGKQFLVASHDFGRVIGETICVATAAGDEIVYAQRPRRAGLTRFVKNRAPEPCSALVAILMKARDEADTYVLVSAFVGHRPEPEPWDKNATANSRAFWDSHALVWGSEPVVPGTETSVCPW